MKGVREGGGWKIANMVVSTPLTHSCFRDPFTYSQAVCCVSLRSESVVNEDLGIPDE